jgi:tetratricopeptide (TPR) repeat protein
MVSQNEGPRRPKKHGKRTTYGPPPADYAGAEYALSQEYMVKFRQAIELGRAGDLKGASEVSRNAISASEAKGGLHEASVILTFLPTLLPGAPPGEAVKLAHRVVALAAGQPHSEYMTSNARFFAMQAQLRANRKPAALEEAEACVVAGKRSKTHCKWVATAWRYYGMLLALAGKMPEALIAMSNAIDLAKTKPTDDVLALARSYDAIGRTLIETNQIRAGAASLRNALDEFKKAGAAKSTEAINAQALLHQIEEG